MIKEKCNAPSVKKCNDGILMLNVEAFRENVLHV
jgi:hypothetical protein